MLLYKQKYNQSSGNYDDYNTTMSKIFTKKPVLFISASLIKIPQIYLNTKS